VVEGSVQLYITSSSTGISLLEFVTFLYNVHYIVLQPSLMPLNMIKVSYESHNSQETLSNDT